MVEANLPAQRMKDQPVEKSIDGDRARQQLLTPSPRVWTRNLPLRFGCSDPPTGSAHWSEWRLGAILSVGRKFQSLDRDRMGSLMPLVPCRMVKTVVLIAFWINAKLGR